MGAFETVVLTVAAVLLATGLSVMATAPPGGGSAGFWMAVAGLGLVIVNLVIIAVRAWRMRRTGIEVTAEACWLKRMIDPSEFGPREFGLAAKSYRREEHAIRFDRTPAARRG